MGRVVSDTSHQRPRPQAMQTHGSWLPRAPKHHHSPGQHACTSASSSGCVPPSSGKAAKLERNDFLLRETSRRALALRMDAAALGPRAVHMAGQGRPTSLPSLGVAGNSRTVLFPLAQIWLIKQHHKSALSCFQPSKSGFCLSF